MMEEEEEEQACGSVFRQKNGREVEATNNGGTGGIQERPRTTGLSKDTSTLELLLIKGPNLLKELLLIYCKSSMDPPGQPGLPAVHHWPRNGTHSRNACLQAVMGWTRDNKLKLNPSKTEVLIVEAQNQRGELDLPVLDGVTFPQKEQVCSLGVLLDPGLTLVSQVEAMARSAFYQLRLIRQLCPFLEEDDLKTVVHQLVISWLDYCNALYVGLPLYVVRKLQLVQHAAARLVSGSTQRDHIIPVLQQLHWLPICFLAKYKVLVITFKALNGLGPSYLRECFLLHDPHRTLKSSKKVCLQLPPVCLVETQRRAFSVAAPGLSNALPAEIRNLSSLLSFRRYLKTYLFGLAFQGF
ncbi:uncharacterized protein LOC128327198 [Hemicordylus capensis]|uniref:uncharacterized protein LOC128327198 n=1 Tax=Hemicordylus capensis TaxID=884348 RepID=UPI002302C658|nr:uncharacterized protein LOC128327198 [Hemicordylus capensis]